MKIIFKDQNFNLLPASGMTERDIFKKFPRLTHKDVLACLDFAAEREKGFL